MALNTPKRIKTIRTLNASPGSDGNVIWRDCLDATNSGTNISNSNCSAVNGSLSPASSCDSPELSTRHSNNNSYSLFGQDGRENRRGRPRSEALTTLMIEGSTSPSAIKCGFCNRVFPREKSLQAHLRTHTGERPYLCDYPGCSRAFTQSGQLKTHQRLHTGERPFMCSAPSCQMRFTHANRHCPEHPYDQLKRCDDFVIQAVTEQNHEVIKWLEKYKMEKEDRTPTRKTPKQTKNSLCKPNLRVSEQSNENYNANAMEENQFPVTPSNPYKSRKGLMVELDMNAGLGASPITGTKVKPTPKVIRWQEPLSQEEDSADEFDTPAQLSFNPKKRWLREAWQEDLAKPLEIGKSAQTGERNTHKDKINALDFESPSSKIPIQPNINPNQMRPTVLMVASKDKAMRLLDLTPSLDGNTNPIEFTSTPVMREKQNCTTTSNYVHKLAQPISPNISPLPTANNHLNFTEVSQNYATSLDPNCSMQRRLVGDNSIESLNKTPSVDTTKNRKWLGALALMQLATDESSPMSSTFSGTSSLSSSISSSNYSTSPSTSLHDGMASVVNAAVTVASSQQSLYTEL